VTGSDSAEGTIAIADSPNPPAQVMIALIRRRGMALSITGSSLMGTMSMQVLQMSQMSVQASHMIAMPFMPLPLSARLITFVIISLTLVDLPIEAAVRTNRETHEISIACTNQTILGCVAPR